MIKKIINNNRIFLLLILLGLATRLLLILLPGFKIDVDDWFAWSIRLSHFDFSHFYSKDVFTDYTPGYLYILSLLGFTKNLLHLPDNIFYLLLKVPALISEIIIGVILYRKTRMEKREKIAIFVLCAILFNPVMIFNSSVWGQIDGILALFLLITIIALKQNSLILSSIFFGLALLIKPQALAIIPVLAIFLVRHFTLINFFKLLVPGLFLIFILTFPFFPNHTLINLAQHITNTANEYQYTSLNAYNFWGWVGFWIPDSRLSNGISYQTWGYLLLASYWLILMFFYFNKKLSVYTLAGLATMGFFFLPTRVHERYLYPTIVFLILILTYYKSRFLLLLTGILSFLHLLNLYYVYIYYNEIYFKLPQVLYLPMLYNFLAENSKSLSLISTVIFILISVTIIKYNAKIPQED